MKKILIILCLVFLVSMTSSGETKVDFYNQMADELELLAVMQPDEITEDYIINRNGKLVIEKFIGIVLNDQGDGRILNTASEYNYICYSSVDNIKPGNIIITYCIYNPDTNYSDDIVARYDYVIDDREN